MEPGDPEEQATGRTIPLFRNTSMVLPRRD
jgi:hypothetical protein